MAKSNACQKMRQIERQIRQTDRYTAFQLYVILKGLDVLDFQDKAMKSKNNDAYCSAEAKF